MRQFRYFVAAAETGQFSMAATAEHVSQSAITNAVLTLEQRLAVRLFDRLPHGVALTAEGHLFHQHARQILDSVEDALREPRFQVHGLKGSVRLAASYTVLGYFLPGLLARFRTNYPDIELDLLDMDRPEIEKAVLSGDIELGIALLSNLERPQRFARHTLIRSRRQLWTSATHPLLATERPSLRDIAAYPYILITVDEAESSTMRYWRSRKQVPKCRVPHQFNGSAARAGRARLWRHSVVRHGVPAMVAGGQEIAARPIADAVPDMEVGMLWQPGRKLEKPADALREFLIHACGS
ncbi:LysR family transcriptional regulator [Cupriavidus basilensis]